MTPAARVAAAIEILDGILAGKAAEPVLSAWARANRYAGSKDRAAIRDHVFDALRCRRSYAWLGGAETGRGLMLGACRDGGIDPASMFDGSRFAPAPLTPDEAGQPLEAAPRGVRLDVPDWQLPLWDDGPADPDAAMTCLRHRAGVFLRVNARKGDVAQAQARLLEDGIETAPVAGVPSALQVMTNPRRISSSRAYAEGLVELQDPASQIAVARLDLRDGMRVLDLCAGGGGKALAMAARADLQIVAHDIDPARMADIAPRAARAGVRIHTVAPGKVSGRFDLVLIDAPCSGSGTWRRAPQAKWALTPDRLSELTEIQSELLSQGAAHLAPGGMLAYATCSVFRCENEAQVAAFSDDRPAAREVTAMRLDPAPRHDGFYLRVMTV
ncbi:MAG: RsmB/NOP family class I SAM-dependent RNA methyltransferase [Alphaproteobacteria bacterium]|jgi:16S rRNA (cytosine967-C5)-methyltransferase|nr:RsmB/NOP family class I SAM-dependent RNA methyltransferase [Alphaproteobacteria bacterium]